MMNCAPPEEASLESVLSLVTYLDIEAGLLYSGGDREIYVETLRYFDHKLREDLTGIQALVQQQSWDQARRQFHSMRGMSGAVGAVRLQKACGELETLLAHGDLAGVNELMSRFELEVEWVLSDLARLHAVKLAS